MRNRDKCLKDQARVPYLEPTSLPRTRELAVEAKRKSVAAYWAAPGDATWLAAAEAAKAANSGQWPTAPRPELETAAAVLAVSDHHCFCGKYGGWSNDHGKTWWCFDHYPDRARGRP
jgi:hypothetical protein